MGDIAPLLAGWPQRLDSWIRDAPLVVLLVLAALVVSSVVTIGGALLAAARFGSQRIWWRRAEYRRLANLFAGMSEAKLEETLGQPLFVQSGQTLREYAFKGRDFWVQAVVDGGGTVQLLAVTSTSRSFRPSFATPLGRVTLLRSELASVKGNPGRIRYYQSGATANSFFFDQYYAGNPGLYKTYFFGVNDIGPFHGGDRSAFLRSDYRDVAYPPQDSVVAEFRRATRMNTYAETAVFAKVDLILSSCQIGVNRIQARTAR